ncbi:lutropin-choriogonadotropic hormone receptor-like isoform X2 [Lepisosteus oculatus]|uniref:lutropin-choriogonadotropic hormone receptor-like isoform X2 n=1 Tax=Lepisosteus oculatus TaxID=7918 RepID=UPI0035F51874
MAVRSVGQVIALSCVLHVSLSALSFSCPGICRCSEDSIICTRETQLASKGDFSYIRNVRLTHLPFEEIQSGAFTGLINVSRIEIVQSDSIKRIKGQAFVYLPNLYEIVIQNTNRLVAIEKGAFTNLTKLKYLSICNTGVRVFPDLTMISSLESSFLLELGDNMHITTIPPNAFLGMTEEYSLMNLFKNGFREIQSYAFNGTKLDKLVLKDNKYLRRIHKNAFSGATGPSILDVSSTALQSLPAWGLQSVKVLTARSTHALKTLPPLDSFLSLQEAQLTYPSHCCAFRNWHAKKEDRVFLGSFMNLSRQCPGVADQEILYPSDSGLLYSEDSSDIFGINFHYPDLELCVTNTHIKCTPEPDAFNPCEDILGYNFLRAIIWIITIFAIAGNFVVLLVLLTSHYKLTVPRFLMCNLAFADLCMGVYLLLIAFTDYKSKCQYYNYAIEWQTGAGCTVAGFLTVFASELSVYTLTAITLERWHTITHAMQLERKLRLRHATAVMAGGWAFSLLMALLPIGGVSSYSKVSMCLPMDIETPMAQGYIVFILILNVIAFFVICTCYVKIYLTVRNPELATKNSDAKIAKRMAVLIFTDFLCMAPISFFAISAVLRMPLITISHSKILLVLFYPINSFSNPFLYAIFTRAFRRDVFILLSRFGCCKAQADLYRTRSLSAQRSAMRNASSLSSAKRSSQAILSLTTFSCQCPGEKGSNGQCCKLPLRTI